jgi:hypothetical protein
MFSTKNKISINEFKKKNILLINYFILITFLSFVFFWDIKYPLFQIRFLIIFLVIPFIFFYKSKLNSIKLFFFPILFIFLHLIFISFFYNVNINIQRLYEIIFLYYFCVICFSYKEIIINNLDLFVLLFLLIFLPSIFFMFLIHPIKTYSLFSCYPGWFALNEFIYSENSHFGMISSSIVWYSVFRLFSNKIGFFFKLLLIIFIIFSFINVSTSFLVATLLTSFLVTILFFKRIKYKEFLFILFLAFTSFLILIFNSQCFSRFNDTIKVFKINLSRSENDQQSNTNMSTDVYIASSKVLIYSLRKNVFGYGVNQYEHSYKEYFEENIYKYDLKQQGYLFKLNNKDASNNFVKLLCEFGIFSIIIFYFIIKLLLNNSRPLFLILFFIAPLISQFFFRGAGYFNGGFLFFLFFTIILSYEKYSLCRKILK